MSLTPKQKQVSEINFLKQEESRLRNFNFNLNIQLTKLELEPMYICDSEVELYNIEEKSSPEEKRTFEIKNLRRKTGYISKLNDKIQLILEGKVKEYQKNLEEAFKFLTCDQILDCFESDPNKKEDLIKEIVAEETTLVSSFMLENKSAKESFLDGIVNEDKEDEIVSYLLKNGYVSETIFDSYISLSVEDIWQRLSRSEWIQFKKEVSESDLI
jgi:hypothetical protein